jgi:3-dehydroquinate synthase
MSNSPEMRKVRVDLGPRSYDVLIGRKIIDSINQFLDTAGLENKKDRFLIVDDNVPLSFVYLLETALEIRIGRTRTVFSGERAKSLSEKKVMSEIAEVFRTQSSNTFSTNLTEKFQKFVKLIQKRDRLFGYTRLISQLAEEKIPRSGTIIALGGGVIGDLAGFVAATYLRGINFVQVPTTLLAMVDSSVGGKTGVNLSEGKNLVGAFHQPKLVVADLDALATLPAKEFSAGMAEVIKYGCIRDRALFDLVAVGIKHDNKDLAGIVEKCVAIKARIVENDEFETKGERALLNFGHTIGHAIEKATGYKKYLHGEAISLGMRAAAWLSVWNAGLPEADAKKIEAALKENHLPLQLDPAVDSASILAALGNDKKVAADGANRWVLLKKLGEAESGFALSSEFVAKAVELLLHP